MTAMTAAPPRVLPSPLHPPPPSPSSPVVGGPLALEVPQRHQRGRVGRGGEPRAPRPHPHTAVAAPA
eukprot:1054121-Prorocentrum_minimum.AAC.1